MLWHFLVPQKDVNSVIWQDNGALSQRCDAVAEPNIPGKMEVVAVTSCVHPHHPIKFSIWGFVKGNVYIPRMSVDLQDLCERTNTVAVVDVTFLNKMCYKLEYHLDVCRVTSGSHIE